MNIKQIMMAILVVALSTVAAAAVCTDAQTKAFEKWDRDWAKHGDDGNRAELEKIYADDYRGIGMLGLSENDKKATIDNTINNVGSNPNVKTEFSDYIIYCSPNVVTITHRNTNFVTTKEGNENTFYSRIIHVLEKRNGNWQVLTSMGQGLTGHDPSTILSKVFDENQAAKNRDLDWFKKNYADGYVGILNSEGFGNITYTKAQMIEFFEGAWKDNKSKQESFKLSDVTMRVEGDTGIISGVIHTKGIDNDGKPSENQSRFSSTYVKKDDKWMKMAGSSIQMETKMQ